MSDARDLARRLADTAAGTWGEEAAIWLLTTHGHWLPELQRVGLIREQAMAGGDTATVIRGIVGQSAGLIGTPSEWQVLDLAMALYRASTTPLLNLTSLDEANRRLVLHAIAWAAGGRQWAESLRLTARWRPSPPAAQPAAGRLTSSSRLPINGVDYQRP